MISALKRFSPNRGCLLGFALFVGICVQAKLSTPVQLLPANNATDVNYWADLTCQSVSGNNTFEWEVAENAAMTGAVLYTSTSYFNTVGQLDYNTTYYWRVRRKNSSDSSDWTGVRSFTTTSSFYLTNLGFGGLMYSGQIINAFSSVHDSFEFFIDTVSGFNSPEFQRIVLPDTFSPFRNVSFVLRELYFGKTYYVKARSFNTGDTSDWSDVKSALVRDTVLLSSPAQVAGIYTDQDFTYGGAGFCGYRFQLSGNMQFTEMLSEQFVQDVSKVSVEELDFDDTVYWRVKAVHSRDSTNWSQVRTGFVDGLARSSPYLSSTTEPEVIVRPYRVYYADTLEMQVDTSTQFNSSRLLSRLIGPEDTLKDLEFGTSYYIRVRPLASHDTGDWSRTRFIHVVKEVSFRRPYSFKEAHVHDTISWDLSYEGVNGYQIQCDTTLDFNSPLLVDSSYHAPILYYSVLDGNTFLFNQKYYRRGRMWHDGDTSDWEIVPSYNAFTTVSKPTLNYPSDGPLIPPGTDPVLTWNPFPKVGDYRVQLDTSADFNSPLLLDSMMSNNEAGVLPVKHLRFGATYYWRVKAYNAIDSSEWSETWSMYVRDKVRLDYPKNNAVNTFPNTLDWNSQSGTNKYKLAISTDSTFTNYDEFSDTATPPFFWPVAINYLNYNTSYFWKVKVFHDLDSGEWSDIWKFTTRKRIAPEQISPANDSMLVPVITKLSWQPYPATNSYRYKVSTDSLFTSVVYNTVISSTTTGNIHLLPNTVYYWNVQGRNSDGKEFGEPSETWKFTTDSGFITPQLNSPADQAELFTLDVSLNWTGSTGSSYEVQWALSPGMSSPGTKTTSATNTLISLQYGKTYYWRVRAKNNAYATSWSEVWSFKVKDPNSVQLPELHFQVYPNPSSGAVHIDGDWTGEATVILRNFLGQKMAVYHVVDGQGDILIPESIATGTYILEIQSEDGVGRVKLQVE